MINVPYKWTLNFKGFRFTWSDILVMGVIAAFLSLIVLNAKAWSGHFQSEAVINLSLWSLPKYAIYTFSRAMVAFAFSLVFGIGYAYWAYYDKRAEPILLPTLDILQSIPVLGFLPALVLAMVALFPHSNFGLEMACVLMIFTAQAWNLAFSFYDSLKSIPEDLRAICNFYGFTPWQRFWKLELPAGIRGLVFNAIISFAAGWFLITVEEAFTLQGDNFQLEGLGSYMSVAMGVGNIKAQCGGLLMMCAVIVAMDIFFLRPLVVWSRRYKLEDIQVSEPEQSFVLEWLARSKILQKIGKHFRKLTRRKPEKSQAPVVPRHAMTKWLGPALYIGWIVLLVATAIYGATHLFRLLSQLSLHDWGRIFGNLSLTFLRVMGALFLSLLWTLPAGIWIGLHPKWSRLLQPFIQVAASFPAPMVYPLLIGAYLVLGGTLQTGAVILMMFGTQWYILFNVVSGVSAIPQDLLSCADLLHLKGWQKWRRLYLPGIFPVLITGLITASGGAWNTSIVAEYVQYKNDTLRATGLGALITEATNSGNFALLAAAVMVMAVTVVLINRTVWRRLYDIANTRYKMEI
ncbi:MAG: ABC transporter permease subunit [Chthoniobacterales bacterium]